MKLNIALWFVQAFLCFAFVFFGSTHLDLIQPFGTEPFKWELVNPEWLPTFIGLVEIAGALGILLPSITRIMPSLTVWAAKGIMAISLLSAGVHIGIGDMAPTSGFVLVALAYFVAWGRSTARPISE